MQSMHTRKRRLETCDWSGGLGAVACYLAPSFWAIWRCHAAHRLQSGEGGEDGRDARAVSVEHELHL